jgi:hypothetical protein
MKSRLILVLVALLLLWGNSYVLMRKMGEDRGRDLLAFRLLRLQDQAFLMSRAESVTTEAPHAADNFWVLQMSLSENGAEPELKDLKGQRPSDLDSSQLATLVAESNVERGSFVVPAAGNNSEFAVGFSKKGASYYFVGQNGQEWFFNSHPWNDYFKWNLLSSGILLLVILAIRFLGLRKTKEVSA